jgi:exosortase
VAGILVAGAIFVVYLPVFGHALEVWQLDPSLSFGFFGPPGAAALLLTRRRQLVTAVASGSRLGLPVLVGGLLMLVAGYASGVHVVSGLSLLPTCLGAAAYLAGLRFANVLGLPLTLLTATISLYLGFLNSLGFWLQQVTAAGAAGMAGIAGTPVVRSGVDLFVGNTHFVVAEACSGMNSLLALLYLGFIVAAFVTPSWPARLLLLASAVPIVLLTNIIRVTVVLVTSGTVGSDLETGLPHEILSAGMFLCAGLLFVLLAFALGRRPWLRAS